MDHITIHWHGPYQLHNLDTCQTAQEHFGVYAIYRKFGKSAQILIYVGQTTRPFIQRLSEHRRSWLSSLRGTTTFRLGIMELAESQRFTQSRLDDVEALLIQFLQPIRNNKGMNLYRGRRYLTISNVGRRGLLPKAINANEDLDWPG